MSKTHQEIGGKTALHRLRGQKAIVTGASSGIGQGIAIALAEAGAHVLVNYHSDEQGAGETLEAIGAFNGQAFDHQADVSDEGEVQAMFDHAIREMGTVDILVNNAGLQQDEAFERMTLDQWQNVIDVNLTGQFLCARTAVREFLRRGVVPEVSSAAGKIICISSVHEVIPWAGRANYAASKGGLTMLMQTLTQELGPKAVRCNSIAPGAIRTPINKSVWDDPKSLKQLLALIPSGRIGEVEDVARAAVWLASDESDYVNGTTLFVDGGMTCYPGFREGG